MGFMDRRRREGGVSESEGSSGFTGVDETLEPVLPVFGLDLPQLPSFDRVHEEQEFMSQGLEGLRSIDPGWGEIGEKARSVLEQFDDRETFDAAPLEALRALGLLALRPGRAEWLPPWQPQPGSDSLLDQILRDLHSVRGLVWAGVSRWQQRASWAASHEERQQARKRLQEFGRALVPEGRGRPSKLGPPWEVLLLGHRQLLFRLKLARDLLDDDGPSRRVRRERIAEVVEQCGLREEWLREWLFYSDRWERKSRTLTAEEAARNLLSRISGLTPESIATSISRGRSSRGRGAV